MEKEEGADEEAGKASHEGGQHLPRKLVHFKSGWRGGVFRWKEDVLWCSQGWYFWRLEAGLDMIAVLPVRAGLSSS